VDAKISRPGTPDEIKARRTAIEQENVKLQIEHLMTYPLVKTAVTDGKIKVHGLYYDLETGGIKPDLLKMVPLTGTVRSRF